MFLLGSFVLFSLVTILTPVFRGGHFLFPKKKEGVGTFFTENRTDRAETEPKCRFFGCPVRLRLLILRTSVFGLGVGFPVTLNRQHRITEVCVHQLIPSKQKQPNRPPAQATAFYGP